jgi:hypothetical protein
MPERKVKGKSASSHQRTTRKTGAKPSAATTVFLIDEHIRTLGGWRAEVLTEVRRLIREADPDIVEECKWIKPSNPWGVPVWSHAGIVCTGETYKDVVKLTFARGAALKDPQRLFNASLEAGTRRAIDLREGDELNAKVFKALIQAAVAANLQSRPAKTQSSLKPSTKPGSKVKLLSGGNPQIAKADGDAPVQAYIAAMPAWKQRIGRWLDKLIEHTLPDVRKAVRWNSPFYGVDGKSWFLNVHCLTKYVKVTFFQGMLLRPIPPGGTPKSKEARWVDIYENDVLDDAQMKSWVQQAAALPGWDLR